MMLPYSWFSITITKTCEKDGTTGAGGGGGAAERVGATDGLGVEAVAVGVGAAALGVAVGVACATGLSRSGRDSRTSRLDPGGVGATTAAGRGFPPKTSTVGMIISAAAPMRMNAPRSPGHRSEEHTSELQSRGHLV